MIRFGSGSPAGETPQLVWWVLPLIAGMGIGAAVFLLGIKIALGSCTTVPEIPAITRAQEVCLAVTRGREADCQWREKKRFNVELIPVGDLPGEAYFTLRVRGEYIGTYAMEDAIPVDLDTLDVAQIDQRLFLRTGNEDIQQDIARHFGRGVFYVEKIVEWIRPVTEGEPAYLSGVGVLAR